jgi:hypothetical protein
MSWPVPLPPATGDEVADLAAFTAWEQAVERVRYPARFGSDGARLDVPRNFDYYLGVPEPSWLGKQDKGADGAYLCSSIPKFVSAARLARYRTDGERWPVSSTCTYAIDSGAYIALNGTNPDVPWFADPDTYGGMILRFIDNNGYPPDFCAPQDWPCEPPVRAKTGFTVRQHLEFTRDSYLWLAREFPMVPWIPVLQGWDAADYLDHERMYLDAGVDLAGARRVGVGSICRRGHLPEIVDVISQFADRGYQLHGFGIKTTALPIIGGMLRSADSMAWSAHARHAKYRLPDCTHTGDCRNCYRYAGRWREQVLATLPNPEEEVTVPTTTITKAAKKKTPAPPDLFSVFAVPWQEAHVVTADRVPGSGERGWFTWSCSCGQRSQPGNQWSHSDLAQSMGGVHARGRTAPLAPATAPVVAEKLPPRSKTFAIDQALIDAPDFPRDHAWWQSFVAEWMGLEMLPDGTVLLTASGSAAQATALGRWIGGTRRMAGAYRRLTRDEAKGLRARALPVAEPVVEPVVETPMLFDLDAMAKAIDAALNQ